MSNIEAWKNPVARLNSEVSMLSPVGDLMEELSDDEMQMLAGACAWYNISCHLGNQGKICTVTVECIRSC